MFFTSPLHRDARFLFSAVTRASGPTDDHSSGVEFASRTVGRAKERKPSDAAGSSAHVTITDDESGEEVAPESDGEEESDAAQAETGIAEPTTASRSALTRAFGEEVAMEVGQVFFQHSARNTPPAEALAMQENTQWRPSERAPLQPYRKSALHPTAYFRVMQNIMQGNNMSLKPHEACMIMSGGSQDAVAAAIALKFKHVPWPPGCVFLGIDVFFSTCFSLCVFCVYGPS